MPNNAGADDQKKPTIDERLEAVTQTLEIVAGMQLENEKQIAQLAHNAEIVNDSIKRLENIALGHEERLDDIENRQ